MTYSIVARDPETGAFGVAVQSHFFGVGRLVRWAAPGVGAVATQAMVELSYGPLGLDLMQSGMSAAEALKTLLAEDPGSAARQVAMVDSEGKVAVHTGAQCVAAAGSARSDSVCALGNMLSNEGCWDRMLTAYEEAEGTFANRLLTALEAAEEAGGDIRGQQSAALLIVGGERDEPTWDAVLSDIRVDDHPAPLVELRRLERYEQAYRDLGQALFSPGAQVSDEALDLLSRGQRVLGDNPEPTLWRGVLLAKAGRVHDANEALAWCIKQRPQLRDFIARLETAGLMQASPP